MTFNQKYVPNKTIRDSKRGPSWEATIVGGNFSNLSAKFWKNWTLSEYFFTGKLVKKFSMLTKSLADKNGWFNSSSKGDFASSLRIDSSICVRMNSTKLPP